MPNAAGAGLAALVTQAYAAIDDDAHWQAWVDGFARLFEHAYGLLLVDERNGRPPRIAVCSQPEALEHYLRSARDTDPLLDNVTLGQMSASRRAWLSHELISERSLRESAFYADFLLPQGNLFYGIGGNYLLAPDLLVQVWAYRGKAHGAFDAQDGELGDLLVRPLLHALELGAHLRQLREEAVHHEAVQDQLIDAVLVLDADNRLLHANARGRDLLEGVARGRGYDPAPFVEWWRAQGADGIGDAALQKFTSAIVQWRAEAAEQFAVERAAPLVMTGDGSTRLGVAPVRENDAMDFHRAKLAARKPVCRVISSRLLGSCGIPATKRSRMTIAILRAALARSNSARSATTNNSR